MSPSAKPSLGIAALLVAVTLAGCVGVGPAVSSDTETTTATTTGQHPTTDSPSTTDATEETERTDTTNIEMTDTTTVETTGATTDTTAAETTVPEPSNASARERATDAEDARVENLLANASNVSGSAGAYGRVEATVLGREDGAIRVRVVMSYSYEYDCSGRSGAVDGKTTEAVYRVTDDAIRLVEVVRDVQLPC